MTSVESLTGAFRSFRGEFDGHLREEERRLDKVDKTLDAIHCDLKACASAIVTSKTDA
jgi:hypothetical protein